MLFIPLAIFWTCFLVFSCMQTHPSFLATLSHVDCAPVTTLFAEDAAADWTALKPSEVLVAAAEACTQHVQNTQRQFRQLIVTWY